MIQSLRRSCREHYSAQEAPIGVFDDFFGANTTADSDSATQAAMAGLTSAGQQGAGYLRGTTRQANNALQTAATNATNDVTAGYGAGKGALSDYGAKAQDALQAGVTSGVNTVVGSNANFQPYNATGTAATGMLDDALGLNGASGNQAATAAFTSSPGYQYTLDQATDAAARKAASLGMSASGNTLQAITTLGSNLADQNYQNWLSNLQNAGSQGLQAASGISNNNQTASGYQYGGGTTGAGLFSNLGSNLSNLDVGQGTALGNIQTGLGTSLASDYENLGQGLNSDLFNVATDNANLGVAQGKADDSAANTNSGIFSKLFGSLTGLPFGGTNTGLGSTSGMTVTPSAGGGYTFSPTGGSGSAGGLFGPTLASAGKAIAGYL